MKTGLHAAAYITLAVSLALLSASCGFGNSGSDDAQQTDCGAYIQIRVPFAAAAEAERTAVPSSSGGSFPVKSYVITASKSGQTDVSATLTDFSIKQKLSLESEGSWTVTVNGYDNKEPSSGTVICTGSGTISVGAAPYYDGYASVTVYPSGTGTGTISLAVSVPVTVKGAKVTLTGPGTDTTAYTAVYTTDKNGGMTAGTGANTFTIASLTATDTTEASTSFAAGEYTMVVQLYAPNATLGSAMNNACLVYRRTEKVAVWQGFATDRWIDAYSFEAGSSTSAAYSTTLAVTADDLADTVTTWQTLTIKSESAEKGTYTSNALPPYIMNADETAELVLTVNKNQTAYVKVDGNQPTCTVSMTESTYTLTYTLPTPSSCKDNTVTVTVFASNGVLFGSYNITYGALYVNETGGSDSANTGSKAYPYKTIAKAVSMLPSSSDANNKIILQSDITTNTTGTANGYAANRSLVSFSSATPAAPLVLTIDGGEHAIKAGGTSDSNRRVMYVGSNVTLTLQNVTLTGGYMSGSGTEGSGGGIYLTGGTLTLGTKAALQGNYAASGGGVYVASGTFVMKNISVVEYTNDVYLAAETYITVDPSFTMSAGNYGAAITSAAGNSTTGTQVLAAESGKLSYAQCNMFALTSTGEGDGTNGISDKYCIVPDSGNGVTAERGEQPSVTYPDTNVEYTLAPSPSSVIRGNAVSMTITSVSASTHVTNPTDAAITLYQNGSSLASLGDGSGTKTTNGSLPSITIPSYLPAGTYQLYMQATVNGKTYSGTGNITVTEN